MQALITKERPEDDRPRLARHIGTPLLGGRLPYKPFVIRVIARRPDWNIPISVTDELIGMEFVAIADYQGLLEEFGPDQAKNFPVGSALVPLWEVVRCLASEGRSKAADFLWLDNDLLHNPRSMFVFETDTYVRVR